MKTIKYVLFFFAFFYLFIGINLFFNADGVLARCFPDGILTLSNRYYSSQWGGPFIGAAVLNILVALQGDRKFFRIVLLGNFTTYVVMALNFWRGYTSDWIPYVNQCLYEELSAQGLFLLVFLFVGWYEWKHPITD